MKRIVLLIFGIVFCIAGFGQNPWNNTGVGWRMVMVKQDNRDSARFNKSVSFYSDTWFNGTLHFGLTSITANGAEINKLAGYSGALVPNANPTFTGVVKIGTDTASTKADSRGYANARGDMSKSDSAAAGGAAGKYTPAHRAVVIETAVALNTAKVTNATHTGDATGSTALTLATVNSSPGIFTKPLTGTINGKGLFTAVTEIDTTQKTTTGTGNILVLSNSPALLGVPTAPTAAPSTNTTQIATTAFVLANGGTGSTDTTYLTRSSVDYFIAASNATVKEKAKADVLCNGTADQVQINAALTAGYNIRLSTGQFNIAAPITASVNNVTIEGSGKEKTIIYVSNGTNESAMYIGGNYWTVKNLMIDNNLANNAGSTVACIKGIGRSNITIDNCELKNAQDQGILIRNEGNNWNITNCYIHDSGAGIYISKWDANNEPKNIRIANCDFYNTTIDSHVVCYGNIDTDSLYNVTVDHCTFKGTTGYMGVYYNTVNNCNVANSYFDMDYCVGAGNGSCIRYTKSTGGIVNGNTFISAGDDGESGVHLWNSNKILISNNYFTDTKGRMTGIGLEAYDYSGYDVHDVTITGNVFYNLSATTSTYGVGMNALSTYTISRVAITGNTFMDDRGASAKNIYAVGTFVPTSLGTIKDITISSNIMEGMLTGGILLQGTSDNVSIINNIITDVPTGITADDGNDVFILGNKFTTNTTPIDINDADVTRAFIDGNNWYGCTNEPSYASSVSTIWGSNVNKVGNILTNSPIAGGQLVIIKKIIGHPGDTGTDFNWNNSNDQDDQHLDMTGIIPAKARVTGIEIICTETLVSSGGAVIMSIGAGTVAFGEQYIIPVTCHVINEVSDIITPTLPSAVILSTSATNLYLKGYALNKYWNILTAGKWDVYITYIQYQ